MRISLNKLWWKLTGFIYCWDAHYTFSFNKELRESESAAALGASLLDSDSDEALLDCPDWSDTNFLAGLGLYSVIITVILFTVTSRVSAEFLSTFFNFLRWCFLLLDRLSLDDFLSDFSRLWVLAGVGLNCWATCWATNCGLILGFLVDVPFLMSHIKHLKASAVLRYVQTLQSQ